MPMEIVTGRPRPDRTRRGPPGPRRPRPRNKPLSRSAGRGRGLRQGETAWPPGSEPREGSRGGTDPSGIGPRREEPRNAKAFVGLDLDRDGEPRHRRGLRPPPPAALRGLPPLAGRAVARRLREHAAGRRRVEPILVPRSALAHDALPYPRRPRALIARGRLGWKLPGRQGRRPDRSAPLASSWSLV